MKPPVAIVIQHTEHVVGYACGECGLVYLPIDFGQDPENSAKSCCGNDRCVKCGQEFSKQSHELLPVAVDQDGNEKPGSGNWIEVCSACRRKLSAERLRIEDAERFEKAQKIPLSERLKSGTEDKLFFREGCGREGFLSLEELQELVLEGEFSGETTPHVWATCEERFHFDLHRGLEDAIESGDWFEDAVDQLPDSSEFAELQAALDVLTEQVVQYHPDFTTALVLDDAYMKSVLEAELTGT